MTREPPPTFAKLAGVATAVSLLVAGPGGLLAQVSADDPPDAGAETDGSEDAGTPPGAARPDETSNGGGSDKTKDGREEKKNCRQTLDGKICSESSGWSGLDQTELDASNCRKMRPPDGEPFLLCVERKSRKGYSNVHLTSVRADQRSLETGTVIGFSEGGCHMYKNCSPKDVTEGTIDLEGTEVDSRTEPYRIVVPFEVHRVTDREGCDPSEPECVPHHRPTSKGPNTFDVTHYQTERRTVELRFELVDGRLELVTDDEPKAEGFRFRLESPN